MAQQQIVQRMKPPRFVEGTPKEIAAHLKTLDEDERLTLIIRGKRQKT